MLWQGCEQWGPTATQAGPLYLGSPPPWQTSHQSRTVSRLGICLLPIPYSLHVELGGEIVLIQ